MSEEKVPDQIWDMMKARLGYSDAEIELFKKDPRNAKVMKTAGDMAGSTVVFEVVDSKGCNSQHKVGTRFYFSGDGNLLTKMSPSKVCGFALTVMGQMMYAIHELWYAGIDANQLCFKRAGCFDVGVQCGGWGHIVIEAKVMDREEAKKLYGAG